MRHTWHAAGLVGQLRGTQNMTRLAKYSADLYVKLEEETGVATGMRQVGSISLGLTADRREELLRQATLARAFDVDVGEISAAEVKDMYPHVEVGDVTCAVHLPGDGNATPPTSRWHWPRARGCGVRKSWRG
jgi:glycine/D-amino acid oxidase-like deaminating enzyme